MGYTPHVIIVGGGAVGTGIARDLALRGLDVTLIERGTLASGRTGSSPPVLYSGAQFAESHPEVARTCIAENRTLFETARHCLEDTGGHLVESDADGSPSLDRIQDACEECGIGTTLLSESDLRDLEPGLDDDVDRALRIPDAVVDPFRLTIANAKNAAEYGATIRTHTTVTDVIVDDGAISAVEVMEQPVPPARPQRLSAASEEDGDGSSGEKDADDTEQDVGDDAGKEEDNPDKGDENDAEVAAGTDSEDDESSNRPKPQYRTEEITPVTSPRREGNPLGDDDSPSGQTTQGQIPGTIGEPKPDGIDEAKVETIPADYVINTAGIGAERIAGLAGLGLSLRITSHPVVVGAGRQTDAVISQFTAGTVPAVRTSLGTNTVFAPSEPVVNASSDRLEPITATAIDETVSAGMGRSTLASARVLRAFPRYRLQVAGHDRPASHGQDFVTIDHGRQHDCWGMTTVLGGSCTTHRHVAERVSDQVCEKFGITRECQTAELPLPGSANEPFPGGSGDMVDPREEFGVSRAVYERTDDRLGYRTNAVLSSERANPVICECQSVTRAEVHDALADETANDADLNDVRIRTTATMGTCQGGRCAHRLASVLHPRYDPETVEDALVDLLDGRWRGQRRATWGDQLRDVARNYRLQTTTLGRKSHPSESVDIEAYDGTPVAVDHRSVSPTVEPAHSLPGDDVWSSRSAEPSWGPENRDDTHENTRLRVSLRGDRA